MVILNPATLTRKSPRLLQWAAFYRTPTKHFNTQIKIPRHSLIHSNWSSASCHRALPSTLGFKVMCRPEYGFGHLGLRSFQVSSGSGAGVGSGGSGDGSTGGGSGSSDGDGGRSSWSLLSWYLSILAKYPVMTKAFTSAFLTLVGDLICQILIDQVTSLDLKRTFIFSLLGLVLVGPTLHFWYLYLSKLVTVSGASGAFLRLLLDQFLFAPIFIGIFLSTLVTLEGRPSHVIPKLQQEWFSSVLANWQLWIPFQFFNFRFVPQQFQVLAANLIALIWNVILSYKAHKEVLAK